MSFAPTAIAGIKAWYDFSDISVLWQNAARSTPVASDGDPIGGMTDKSGVGNHLAQSTSGSRPLYKIGIQNNLSVSRYDGTDDYLSTSPFTALSQPNEMFMVVRQNARRNDQVFDSTDSGHRNTMGYHTDHPGLHQLCAFTGGVGVGESVGPLTRQNSLSRMSAITAHRHG